MNGEFLIFAQSIEIVPPHCLTHFIIMWLTLLALRNRIGILMLSLAMVILGATSLATAAGRSLSQYPSARRLRRRHL